MTSVSAMVQTITANMPPAPSSKSTITALLPSGKRFVNIKTGFVCAKLPTLTVHCTDGDMTE